MENEIFPIVDENGNIIGKSTRKDCHRGYGVKLLHPVVHLHIIDKQRQLILLQKRSANKDIQPSKWDTAVGGHVDFGETIDDALFREAREELGIKNFIPQKICSYIFESNREKELVNVFFIAVDSKSFNVIFDPVEIDSVKFWSVDEVVSSIENSADITPNFADEFKKIKTQLFQQ